MSEAAALPASQEQLGPPERLHPLYLLTGLGQSLRGAWGLIAGGAYFAAQGRWWIVVADGRAVRRLLDRLAAAALAEARISRRRRMRLRIDSGWLSRTSRAIPFDRVTDVDLEQGPLHRLFGLARVKLETGGIGRRQGGGRRSPHHLARRGPRRCATISAPVAGSDGSGRSGRGGRRSARRFTPWTCRRVLTAGLFNFSLAVIAGLFGVTQTMGDALGFDPFERPFWLDLLDRVEPLRDLVLAHQIVAVIGRHRCVLILLGIGTGLVRTLLREYGFRLDRTETGFRRRRGLLTLTDVIDSGQAGPGGDPRQRPDPPALRLVGAEAAEPRPGRRQGRPCRRSAGPRRRSGADPRLARLADRAGAGWLAASVARLCHSASSASSLPAALATALRPAVLRPRRAAVAWRCRACDRRALAGLEAHPLRARRRPTLFVETGWWRHRRSIVPTRKIQSVDLSRELRGAGRSAFARCGSASPAAADFPTTMSPRLTRARGRGAARGIAVMSPLCLRRRTQPDSASPGAGGARAATSLAAT